MCKIWVHANYCMWYWSGINRVYWCTISRLCSFDSFALSSHHYYDLLQRSNCHIDKQSAVGKLLYAGIWTVIEVSKSYHKSKTKPSLILKSTVSKDIREIRATESQTHAHTTNTILLYYSEACHAQVIIMWLLPWSYTAYDKGSNLRTRLFIKPI